MTLTLGNPLGGVATGAVSANQFTVVTKGSSLATGRTADNDVVSEFLGKNLGDKYVILSKIQKNIGYSMNAMKIASSSLDSIAKTLVDMLAVVAQATSDTNLNTLNDILKQKLEQVKLQTEASTFDGRKLLTGSLGQDSTVRTNFTNKAVSVNSMPAAGNFLGLGAATAGTTGVFTAQTTTVIADDTLIVNGVTFTALANGTARAPGSATFQAGAAAGAPGDLFASNDLLVALRDVQANGTTAERLALANYVFTTDGVDTITATQVTNHDEAIAQAFVPSGATIVVAATAAGVTATGPNVASNLLVSEVVAGDSVVIEGVEFKAVAGEPKKPNEFSVGISAIDSASNLASAIQTSKSETLQSITSTIVGNIITLTAVSQGTNSITVINKSGSIAGIEKIRGSGSGIDLSGIKSLEGFIGVSSKPIFTFEDQETGLGAQAKARAAGNVLANSGVAAGAADSVAIYSTTIGGRKFIGALYEPNAAANLNSKQLTMIEPDTGEYFTVTTAAGYAGRINTPAAAGSTGGGVAADINTLFATTNFSETKTLVVNTDRGDILVNSTPVASTKNTSVKLTATDFTNMQFKDFIIEPGAAVGSVKFTAVINDKDNIDQRYTAEVDAVNIQYLVEGYKLNLIDSTGGTRNTLSINIGDRGLTSLNLAANYAAVAEAYKGMLLSTGDGLEVRVGLNFEDVIRTKVSDLSASKLYLDKDGLYRGDLSLSTDASRKIAQEVITNALAKVRGEQSMVTSQMESIRESSDALARTIQVTKEGSDGYLNTDLIEAAQAFSEAVKRTIAAISTLEAGNKVSDAAQRVIQSIA